jgi:hypothetical protein
MNKKQQELTIINELLKWKIDQNQLSKMKKIREEQDIEEEVEVTANKIFNLLKMSSLYKALDIPIPEWIEAEEEQEDDTDTDTDTDETPFKKDKKLYEGEVMSKDIFKWLY